MTLINLESLTDEELLTEFGNAESEGDDVTCVEILKERDLRFLKTYHTGSNFDAVK